jgi:hypothetical protein
MAIHSSVAIAAQYFASTADATAATKLGYTKTKDISNGQAICMATKTSTVKGLTYY